MCRCRSHGRHCCGLGTKKSVILSAFYSVFTAVVCMSMMLLRFTTKVDVEIHADVSVLSYGSLAVYSIHIIVSFVLLAGANLDRRGAFFPWFAWTCIVMVYEGLAVLLYFSASKHKQKGFRRWDIFCSFFYAIRTAINVFCIICVLCRYRIIRIPEETPCTYVFPSPEHCERRPRLQKHLITIMESALRTSTPNLHADSVIMMSSLPPPYETAPPPYGELMNCGRTFPASAGGSSRVIVECRDVTSSDCECKMIPNETDPDATSEGEAFLGEKYERSVDFETQEGSIDPRLRHGAIVWDDSDKDNVVTEEEGRGAVVYRNPMVTDSECIPMEHD